MYRGGDVAGGGAEGRGAARLLHAFSSGREPGIGEALKEMSRRARAGHFYSMLLSPAVNGSCGKV